MKTCKKCNQEFRVHALVNGKTRNLQRRDFCLDCSPFNGRNNQDLTKLKRPKKDRDREKSQRWLSKNPDHQRNKRNKRKKDLVALKGGKCVLCGYDKCIAALQFHHRDPKKKSFDLSSRSMLRAWDGLIKEAKKCDLVCANCHTEIHWGAVA